MNNNDILLEKIKDYCPICDEEHELEKKQRKSKLEIKDLVVEYDEIYFRCTKTQNEENEFVTSEMMDNNLLNAKDEYRRQKHLLTSQQIKDIRKKYGITQAEFSFLLGLGEITITRYEKKLIQDETYDKIMRLVNDNAFLALDYLKDNKDKFKNLERYEKIENNIKKVILSDTLEYLNKQEIEVKYVDFESESKYNGFKKLDIDKIETLVKYIAERCEDLYKVKLMKLLWYSDMLYYKDNGKSITGLVYTHQKLGALPIGADEIVKLKSIKVKEEDNVFQNNVNSAYHILPNKEYKVKKLLKEESNIVDKVIERFKDFNTNMIVEYMHKEKAYTDTKTSQVIDYNFAKYIEI